MWILKISAVSYLAELTKSKTWLQTLVKYTAIRRDHLGKISLTMFISSQISGYKIPTFETQYVWLDNFSTLCFDCYILYSASYVSAVKSGYQIFIQSNLLEKQTSFKPTKFFFFLFFSNGMLLPFLVAPIRLPAPTHNSFM